MRHALPDGTRQCHDGKTPAALMRTHTPTPIRSARPVLCKLPPRAQNNQNPRASHAFLLKDGARCPYLDIDDFLAACEAKTAYADYRDDNGYVLYIT